MLSPGKIFLLNSRLIKPTAYSPCPNRHFQLDIPKTDLWAFLKNHALSTVFPSRSMVVPAFQLEIGPDSWTLLFPSHTTPPLSPSPNPAGSTFTLYSRTHLLPPPLCPPVQTTISLAWIRQLCSQWCRDSTLISPRSIFNSAAREILSRYVSSRHLFMQNSPKVPCSTHSKG